MATSTSCAVFRDDVVTRQPDWLATFVTVNLAATSFATLPVGTKAQVYVATSPPVCRPSPSSTRHSPRSINRSAFRWPTSRGVCHIHQTSWTSTASGSHLPTNVATACHLTWMCAPRTDRTSIRSRPATTPSPTPSSRCCRLTGSNAERTVLTVAVGPCQRRDRSGEPQPTRVVNDAFTMSFDEPDHTIDRPWAVRASRR